VRSGAAAVALLLAVASAGIARVQPRVAGALHTVNQRDDVFLLPPPGELRVLTLGYHAAAADALWAQLLVEYGTHLQEKRPFGDVTRYLDGILALEPGYDLVYKYADTLLIYHAPVGTEADWYTAKDYLARGTRERPYDHATWLHYGQFLAYASASFVTKSDEVAKFRKEGADAIMHAVDLGADPDRSITAATLQERYGERDEAVRRLSNHYALTDDEHERALIAEKLRQLDDTTRLEAAQRAARAKEARWRKEYRFLTREAYLLVGPIPDPIACAGRRGWAGETTGAAGGPPVECARDWSEAVERARTE
jgi:hypothetical protein